MTAEASSTASERRRRPCPGGVRSPRLSELTNPIASTYVVIRLAAGVYEGAVLRAGPRLSVSDIWRAARAARAGTR